MLLAILCWLTAAGLHHSYEQVALSALKLTLATIVGSTNSSDGGHLAMLVAYASDRPRFITTDVQGVDLSVRAVVAYYDSYA